MRGAESLQQSVGQRHVMAVTGTRADFGLMQRTFTLLAADPYIAFSLLVTGMHLDATHGFTVSEVRASGWRVAAEVAVDTTTRTPVAMAQGVGVMTIGMAEVLARERPDLVVVLGDRGEMLAAAVAALHLGLPCVHVHGGERSGTVDDPVRHAISKLAAWHLVATPESRDRLVRMGEPPERVHVVGAPGLDGLVELASLPLAQAWPDRRPDDRLMAPPDRFALVVFHPVVPQAGEAAAQTAALSAALVEVGLPLLWLAPNADAGSKEVTDTLTECATEWPDGSQYVTHLPRPRFVSLMRQAAVMVGNSSAGIIEAASFGTPVVNVGDRQRLRERNANVMDVTTHRPEIVRGLRQALAIGRFPLHNRYGDGHAAERIVAQLTTMPLQGLMEKAHVG